MPTAAPAADPLITQLRNLYDAEQQLVHALPAWISCAKSAQLNDILVDHLEETKVHVVRLRQAFRMLRVPTRRAPCDPIAVFVRACDGIIDRYGYCGSGVLDIELITVARRIEHYEIAAYRTVIARARALGRQNVADLLALTLREERVSERLLTMAETTIQQDVCLRDAGRADHRGHGIRPRRRNATGRRVSRAVS